MSHSQPGRQPHRQPRFFWQGCLIILPAVLLAGFGLFSLRQDRLLAGHEASAQAARLAESLATTLSARLAFPPLPRAAQEMQQLAGAITTASDPVPRALGLDGGRVAFLCNASGALIYPSPDSPQPPPALLDTTKLPPGTAEAWHDFAITQRAGPVPRESLDRWREFLSRQPPEEFAAHVTFAIARELVATGDWEAGRGLYEEVIQRYPLVMAENGWPLRLFAGLGWLEVAPLSPEGSSKERDILRTLLSVPVLFPASGSESFAAKIRDRLAERSPPGWAVQELEHAAAIGRYYEAARRAWRDLEGANWLPGDTNPKSINVRWLTNSVGAVSLIRSRHEDGLVWCVAERESFIQDAIRTSLELAELPETFGTELMVAEQSLLRRPDDEQILAEFRLSLDVQGSELEKPVLLSPGSSRRLDSVRSSAVIGRIQMARPDLYFARQQARTRMTAATIALATAAVLAGFLAAYRAFRRQRQLHEMKGNFVSSVSHELRAPIASVRLIAEELQELGPADGGKRLEYHKFIVQECRRLSHLIENVLDFSRQEQGRKDYEFESVDLSALVRETARIMQPCAQEKSIRIQAPAPHESIPAEVDAPSIQQVVVNLLDNAIKHSPSNSEITVTVTVSARSNDVRLAVEDHGEGIPKEDQARVFERFYRRGSELRRETPGVGLGLAIVHYIVQAHRGRIELDSEVGRGSRFTIILPAQQPTSNAS